jgi:hypothetical protein
MRCDRCDTESGPRCQGLGVTTGKCRVSANAHLVQKKQHGGQHRVKKSAPDAIQWTHLDALAIANKLPVVFSRTVVC